jgi:hypothetical protein
MVPAESSVVIEVNMEDPERQEGIRKGLSRIS